jgi:hypothetical protein
MLQFVKKFRFMTSEQDEIHHKNQKRSKVFSFQFTATEAQRHRGREKWGQGDR